MFTSHLSPHAIGTLLFAVLIAAWAVCGLAFVAGMVGLVDAPPPRDRQQRRLLVVAVAFAASGFAVMHLADVLP